MERLSWRTSLDKAAVAVAVSVCAVFSATPAAIADEVVPMEQPAPAAEAAPLDARVEEALNELTRLNVMAEQSQYDLISSTSRLNTTEALIAELDVRINQLSEELKVAKSDLAKFVSDDYKSGNVSLLDIIFQSKSFDDMVSRIVYANKVAEHKNQTIAKVDNLFKTLGEQRSKLSQAHDLHKHYADEQAQRQAVVEQAASSAEVYYAALSEDVKVGLNEVTDEQRAAAFENTMAQLNELAAAQPAEEEAQSFTESVEAAALVQELAAEVAADAGGEYSSEEVAEAINQVVSTGGYSGDYGDMVSRAYSLLGAGYQWSGYNWTGETDSSSFTCSGVVDYALGRDSQSSSPETLYEEVGDNLVTDVDQLQEGDLVFYSYGGREVGHVGVYVGNGQVIDSIPNGGVAVRDVEYMDVVGGGSL